MDGPISQHWELFLRHRCVHVFHVRMCKKAKKYAFLIAQGVLNNMLAAVSSTGVTRKSKRNNTATLRYMKLGKVSYRQPNCCLNKGSQFKGPFKCSPEMRSVATILHGLTYPKILCAPKKEIRKRENGNIT